VVVEFLSGNKAVLTIFWDGAEKEKVQLQTIETEAKMHQMMIQKGFTLKPSEEVDKIRNIGSEARQKDRHQRTKKQERRSERIKKDRARGEGVVIATSTDKDSTQLLNKGEEKSGKKQLREWTMQNWPMLEEKKDREMDGEEL